MRDYEKNAKELGRTELPKKVDYEVDHEVNPKEKQEEYHFVKEVIKVKPVDVRGMILKGAAILAGAVVFGLVSALVFVRFLPIVQDKMPGESKIVFAEDNPTATLSPAVTKEGTEATDETNQSNDSNRLNEVNTPDGAHNSDGSKAPDATENPDGAKNETSTDEMSLDTYQKINDEMNAIAKDAMRSMVTVTGISSNEDWFNITEESIKQSSGVVIAQQNQEFYILTEYRAVRDVDRVMLTFHDGSMADGRYLKHDPNTGLTVLKVAMEDLPSDCVADVKIAVLGNSYQTQQGEAVIAIGSPMGYSNSIVHGQVTSITSTVSAYDVQYNLLITDILGSVGGSGVLIDLNGNVIGIIAQNFSNENHENVITGLPISQLKSLISVLSNNGEIPYLGIKGQNVTAEITKQTGMPKGIYVNEVSADSPALNSGIQKADVITKYNSKAIETMYQYSDNLSKSQPGETVEITVMRKGAQGYVEFVFQVTLGSR